MTGKYIAVWFFGIVVLLGLGAFSVWNLVNSYSDLPYFGPKKEFAASLRQANYKGFKPIEQFQFINQDSQPINTHDMKGKIWVADYFFTRCPSICPQMTQNLTLVQDAFMDNDQVRILSFTCDPAYDQPAKLKDYASAFNADFENWQFITGNKPELYRFARKQLFITATEGSGGETDFIHEQYLVLIDKDGYRRGYYDGTNAYEVRILINDIKKLLK